MTAASVDRTRSQRRADAAIASVMASPDDELARATPRSLGFHMPAEWQAHAATWLAWPHKTGDWPGKADCIPWVFASMARHLTRSERVRLLVRDAKEQRLAESVFRRAGVELAAVDFVHCDTDRSWTRDSLPSFVVREEARGALREVAAVKFRFDGWNRYPDHRLDDAAGIHVARNFGTAPAHFPCVAGRGGCRRLTLEGGSIDVDGEGTLLSTEECLLTGARARHKSLGREGSEAVLREMLGADKVIWLPDGIAGDDTSGHVDDFARFVRPGVVVVCDEANKADPNHGRLAAAQACLRAATDARGRRIEVVKLPMPSPVMFGNVRLPASYANFYIANDQVLVPTFDDAMDQRALGILAEFFPRRRVVGIHATELVLGLGTLHCSTQQEPLAKGAATSPRRKSKA